MSERFDGIPIVDVYGDDLNALLYEDMLSKTSSATYRLMKEVVDFKRIEEACAGYHKNPLHKGIVHPVPKMARVLFLKEWNGWSLRETLAQMECDLRCKWFGGYGIFERVPDYTTIDRFEQYVMKTCPRIYFDEILSAIETMYPERAEPKVQIGDTFAMKADAAVMSDILLVRRLCEKLLAAAAEAGHLPPEALNKEALFGKKKRFGKS